MNSDEEEGPAVLVHVGAVRQMEDGHPYRKQRPEQHDDLPQTAVGEQRGAAQHDEQDEHRDEIPSARLPSAGSRVKRVLREVKGKKKNR